MLPLLVRASLEGAVLAAGVWLVCRALPRMSPGVRALLWWCVAAKFVVALVWPAPIEVPVLPRAAADAVSVATAAAPPTPAAAGGESLAASLPASSSDAPAIPWTAILVGVWALGLGVSLLRTLRDWSIHLLFVARRQWPQVLQRVRHAAVCAGGRLLGASSLGTLASQVQAHGGPVAQLAHLPHAGGPHRAVRVQPGGVVDVPDLDHRHVAALADLLADRRQFHVDHVAKLALGVIGDAD